MKCNKGKIDKNVTEMFCASDVMCDLYAYCSDPTKEMLSYHLLVEPITCSAAVVPLCAQDGSVNEQPLHDTFTEQQLTKANYLYQHYQHL